MTGITVIGAGSWGTTLADLLARKGHRVRLWAYEEEVAACIRDRRENVPFLPGCRLHEALSAHTDPAEAMEGAEHVVMVSPSHVTRAVLMRFRELIPPGTIVTSATKGIETETLSLMHAVAAATLCPHRFVALSGPSFARDLYAGQPTAVAVASADPEAATAAQRLFVTGYFRLYSSADVVGTELAGALKNVIAIAAGILEGLGYGDNPRAALITRGLAEMARLGEALGADRRTFAGLAGMGDLVLTTTGRQSRNRTLGEALAKGQTLAAFRHAHRSVAEGAYAAEAAVRLGARENVELPIMEQVWQILYRDKPPGQAIAELMERTLKPEL